MTDNKPPGEIRRVESELIDYQHVGPYRVFVSDRPEPSGFRDYRAANLFTRTQSGARSVVVVIRDSADIAFWEIRLTDRPLGA